jgi:hypothetical protein
MLFNNNKNNNNFYNSVRVMDNKNYYFKKSEIWKNKFNSIKNNNNKFKTNY